MYFDAVLDRVGHGVVFNGTPEETKKFLEENKYNEEFVDHDSNEWSVYVSDGETLRSWSVQEYLAR